MASVMALQTPCKASFWKDLLGGLCTVGGVISGSTGNVPVGVALIGCQGAILGSDARVATDTDIITGPDVSPPGLMGLGSAPHTPAAMDALLAMNCPDVPVTGTPEEKNFIQKANVVIALSRSLHATKDPAAASDILQQMSAALEDAANAYDALGQTNELNYEVDEWNTNGVSSIWVRLPMLASASDFIWAYWGNPGATNPPSYATNGLVWTPNYSVVYHLKESGFPYADSARQYPAVSGTAPGSAAGMIGRGCSFNGALFQYLNAGAINLGNAFTLSAWAKLVANAFDIQTIWANQQGGYGSPGFAWFVNTFKTNDQRLDFASGDGVNGTESTTASGAVSFGPWHLLTAAVNRSQGNVEFYVDGTDVGGSSSVVTDFPNQATVNLGRFTNNSFYFNGILDEARIGVGACSSNWVWASWMTVASNATFAAGSAVISRCGVASIS